MKRLFEIFAGANKSDPCDSSGGNPSQSKKPAAVRFPASSLTSVALSALSVVCDVTTVGATKVLAQAEKIAKKNAKKEAMSEDTAIFVGLVCKRAQDKYSEDRTETEMDVCWADFIEEGWVTETTVALELVDISRAAKCLRDKGFCVWNHSRDSCDDCDGDYAQCHHITKLYLKWSGDKPCSHRVANAAKEGIFIYVPKTARSPFGDTLESSDDDKESENSDDDAETENPDEGDEESDSSNEDEDPESPDQEEAS